MNEWDKNKADTPDNEEQFDTETQRTERAEEATDIATPAAPETLEGTGAVAPAGKAPLSAKPWIAVSVIAVAALAFVLIANPFAGTSAKLGTFKGGNVTKDDFYEEIRAQVPAEQFTYMVDTLIEKKLIEKLADKEGVKVSNEELAAEIAKYAMNFGGVEAFQQVLDQNGITMDMFKSYQIMPLMLKTKLYASQHEATEDDFKKYYDENQSMFATSPKQVRASHILVETKEEADAVLAEIKGGADFAALAKEKSMDHGSAANGGDLDFFGEGQMMPEFEAAAFSLAVGEISDPVETYYGYHIIKVTDMKEAVLPSYEEKKADIQDAYWQEQLSLNETDWLDKLKADNNVKNLVEADEPKASPSASAAQ